MIDQPSMLRSIPTPVSGGEATTPWITSVSGAFERFAEREGIVIAAVLLAIGAALAIFLAAPLEFFVLTAVLCAGAMFAFHMGWLSRYMLGLLLLALSIRIVATLAFQAAGAPLGDDFSGSPDAWNYHRWSVWAGDRLLEGEAPSLSRHDHVGSWNVGFYYLLGFFYLLTGQDPMMGRFLVVLCGALAVVALVAVARELLDDASAKIVGVLYALWPNSILWASYSLLRDSLVWLLLLLSVYLALITVRRSPWFALPFALAALSLRFVRPYAWFLLAGGLAVAAVLVAILPHWRGAPGKKAIRRGAWLGLAAVLVEMTVASVGFPGAVSTIRSYEFGRYVLRGLPVVETSKVFKERELSVAVEPPPGPAVPVPAEGAAPGVPQDLERGQPPVVIAPPPAAPPLPFWRLLAENSVRFLLGPFPWTFSVPSPENWQLPAIWFWYAMLPGAMVGVFLGLKRGNAAAVFLLVVILMTVALIVAGRGDAYRQREMATPGYLLAFVIMLEQLPRHRRLIVRVYVVAWIAIIIFMAVHLRSMADRNLIGDLEGWRRPSVATAWMVEGSRSGVDPRNVSASCRGDRGWRDQEDES